jgi:hypothetical protein
LKDVDDLGTAEFFVRIEKKSSKIESGASSRSWFFAFNSAPGYTPYGFRLGYDGAFDVYIAARFGSNGFSQFGDEITDVAVNSFALGLGRTVYNGNRTAIKIYGGAGIANWGNYERTENFVVPPSAETHNQEFEGTRVIAGNADKGIEVEYGLYWVRGKLQIGAGMTHNIGENATHNDGTITLGLRF